MGGQRPRHRRRRNREGPTLSPSPHGFEGGSLPDAVLLGGSGTALSVARSLARAGVRVHVYDRADSVARHSRFVHRFVACDPVDRQGSWSTHLRQAPEGAALLPCSDEALEFVARNRTRMRFLGLRPFEARDHIVLAMLDKPETHALATEAGIRVPRTALIRDAHHLAVLARDFPFPCALKPASSHEFSRHFAVKLFVVRSVNELQRFYQRPHELGLEMMLTEIVPGGDDAYQSFYSYLDEHGRPLCQFTKRKIRQYPPGFGLISYQVTDWDPEVAELGLHFFRAIGLRGLANVEFKRDARDGQLTLIECNPRFTAANELVDFAGIDLASIAYARAVGLPAPEFDRYRIGVRMWHPGKDLACLAARRRAGTLGIRPWVRSLLHRQHFPMWRWSDPLPSLASLILLWSRLKAHRAEFISPARSEGSESPPAPRRLRRM